MRTPKFRSQPCSLSLLQNQQSAALFLPPNRPSVQFVHSLSSVNHKQTETPEAFIHSRPPHILEMSGNNWNSSFRPHGHRFHRTEAEANSCNFNSADRHFSNLPEYPPLRRQRAPRPARVPQQQLQQEVNDGNDIVRFDSPTLPPVPPATPASRLSSRTPTTPPPAPSRREHLPATPTPQPSPRRSLTPAPGYPTPFSQETARQVPPQELETSQSEAASPTPTRLAGDNSNMMRDRLRSRLSNAHSATPTSFVPETPLQGRAANAALEGPVRHTIEQHDPPAPQAQNAGAASASGSNSQQPRDNTPVASPTPTPAPGAREATPRTQEMNRLRQVNTTLSDTLATTTGTLEDVNARANRLQQRNVLIAAENQQNERQLEDRLRAAEADRQLAHDQADAAVRDTAEARKWRLDVRLVWLWLMAILLVALLAFALWVCWINQIDFEYIRRRRREFYGMD